MELVLITPEGDVVPFARVTGHDGSEVTGPAFSPDGTRLYLSSQRGPTPGTLTEIAGDRGLTGDSRNGGVTFEITGPFRDAGADSSASRSPATTLAEAAAGGSGSGEGDDDVPAPRSPSGAPPWRCSAPWARARGGCAAGAAARQARPRG
jgi:hypothetical protein